MGFNYSWNQIERMHEDALLDAYLEDNYDEDEDEDEYDEEDDDDYGD